MIRLGTRIHPGLRRGVATPKRKFPTHERISKEERKQRRRERHNHPRNSDWAYFQQEC